MKAKEPARRTQRKAEAPERKSAGGQSRESAIAERLPPARSSHAASLKPLVNGKISSLTQNVYVRLRAQILSCELEPGQELSESELAERFSVSKTPVREALATLRSEGFVKTFPRRGYQVVPITFGDMSELFELRTILEAGATELACARITDEEIAHLRTLADAVYDRSEQPSLTRFIAANRDFHLEIARASGNSRLLQQIQRVIDELERFFYLGARLRDVNKETNQDHHLIVKAFKDRNAAKARAIMIQHNEKTRAGLVQQIALSKGASRIAL